MSLKKLQRRVLRAIEENHTEAELASVRPELVPDVLLETTAPAFTPLTHAAHLGRAKAVPVLVDYQDKYCGGDLKTKSNSNTFAALYQAASRSHWAVIETLLWTEDDVNRRGCSGETALHSLCKSPKDVEPVVTFLLSRGARVDIADCKGETCLFGACSQGHEEVVGLLLDKGANPSHPDVHTDAGCYGSRPLRRGQPAAPAWGTAASTWRWQQSCPGSCLQGIGKVHRFLLELARLFQDGED